jgi:phycocyanobilin:ferredoxin oxidoreductase
MSQVWDSLISVQNSYIERFNETGNEIFEEGMGRFNQPGWVNRVWTSTDYRRAHIDVVDARDSKGLWMMHCCVFPHTDNTAPIFGYDVIAGRNKITGFFHDFSSTGYPHTLIDWFGEEVDKLSWRKIRELPDWAKRIFSRHMVAAGNINQQDELDQISSMAIRNLDHYIRAIGETAGHCVDNSKAQDFYCANQKQNPHTPKVMASLGLDEDDVRVFIEECLFPPIR